jgi:hypothetical protein
MIEHLYLVDVYCIFRPVLRDHHWDKEKMSLYDRWTLKRGSINMKLFIIGQE